MTERRRLPGDRRNSNKRAAATDVPNSSDKGARASNSSDERNAGKRWSARDKRDLADALARGDSVEEAASFLLRSVGEVAGMAAELGLLLDKGKYSIVLFHEGGEDAGIEMELARESRPDIARFLYGLMCAQYPGRLVILCKEAQILQRSDRPDSMPV